MCILIGTPVFAMLAIWSHIEGSDVGAPRGNAISGLVRYKCSTELMSIAVTNQIGFSS